MPPAPSRNQLEAAAADVITILKSIREYSDAKVAVIGGLALWKYLPAGRTTQVTLSFQKYSFRSTVDS